MATDETTLVVGDLFIDENWLVARSDNYHSTNVGKSHYESRLESPTSNIISVCGIASILRVLHGPPTEEEIEGYDGAFINRILERRNLEGVGAWNKMDDTILKCIICPKKQHEKRMNPYTLSSYFSIKDNYGKFCKDGECNYNVKLSNIVREGSENVSTNRYFRIYEGFGGDQPSLRERIDWRIDFNGEELDTKLQNLKNLQNLQNVKEIIIVDHGYGVVTKDLVETLCEKCKDAKWYMRHKLDRPDWIANLKGKGAKIRLVVTDEQLIRHQKGARIWRHGTELGRGSLEVLGNQLGIEYWEHGTEKESDYPLADHTAVLFEDNSAIAASIIREKDAKLLYMPRPTGEKMPIEVGRTSIFFASLVYWDMVGELCPSDEGGIQEHLSPDSMGRAVRWALNNMYGWTRECAAAWNEEKPGQLSGPFRNVITWKIPENSRSVINKHSSEYNKSWVRWNESSEKMGLVGNSEQLHLWRAYGTLPEYICPGGEKRTAINNLIRKLDEYQRENISNFPFNCLFLAEPGWGKSYLSKCLSEYFDFEFLSYSIAQMSTTSDLIDSFKVIVSTQNNSNKKVLVFVDEIDAKIGGESVMGLLLGPMWDGRFKIEGNTNRIDPCVWVFASTQPVGALNDLPKGRDFLSRINGPMVNIDYLTDRDRQEIHAKEKEEDRSATLRDMVRDKNQLRTEIVYQSVNILNNLFGPITHVEEDVLELFHGILPVNGIRSLQNLISKFIGIEKGIVRKRNVPLLDEPGDKSDVRESELLWMEELNRHIQIIMEKETFRKKFITDRYKACNLINIRFKP